MIGVNLAGAEFGSTPGRYGYDYIYPNASELDYFKSEGITLIRLPFKWERVQPTLGGELDPAEVGRIHNVLDAAAACGMQVVLDVHNYGRYGGNVIGSDAVPISAFADLWSKLGAEFGGDPGIRAFGLMNEPHDMGGATVWPAAAQAAVDAVRASGASENILVAGDAWSSAAAWQKANGNLHINDPLNKISYEAHVYFDNDNTGTYDGSYDQEGASPDTGVNRLEPFLNWLQEHNAKGFIGEFGAPGSDPRWLDVLDRFVDAIHQNNIDGTAWAAGPWWGNYPLSLEPADGQDKPQLSVLTQYAFDAPAATLTDSAIQENIPGGDVGAVTLGEGDTTGLMFSLSDPRFEIAGDPDSYHLKLRDGISLDYETEHQVTMTATTTNTSGHSSSQTFSIDVLDVPGHSIVGSADGDLIDATHSAPGQPFTTAEGDFIFAMGGNDTLDGGAGNDWLDGGSESDTATYVSSPAGVSVSLSTGIGYGGDAQGDHLSNIEGLIGSAFNDYLEGNGVPNRLDGGLGTDTVTYEHSIGGVTVDLRITNQQASGGDANGDVLRNIENIVGTTSDDNLTGDAQSNALMGGSGNGVLNGASNADTLMGGQGNDTYVVDNVKDQVIESPDAGSDTVQTPFGTSLGDNLENLVLLGSGNVSGSGNDQDNTLTGSNGNNVLSGLIGDDDLLGTAGDDMLNGGPGADSLDGGSGIDTADYTSSSSGVAISLLTGNGVGGDASGDAISNVENVTGSAFDDLFEGNSRVNRFDGGAGIDTVTYENSSVGVAVNLNTTAAQLSGGDAGGDALVNMENVSGSAFDDTLMGNSLVNVVTGGSGNDSLDGWSGADTMIGGEGSDTYTVDNVGDRVIEKSAEGIDTVRSSTTYALGEDTENLVLIGTATINGTGNEGDNAILGNRAGNSLAGLGGNDTLIGDLGNDRLTGGAGSDVFAFGPDSGTDTITDFSSGDVLQFAADVFPDAYAALAASSQSGNDVVVTTSASDFVKLNGVSLSTLHADDFNIA